MADFGSQEISIDVSLNPQQLYDRARSVGMAWLAMADSLAKSGRVCTHPEEFQVNAAGAVVICSNCSSIVEFPDG